MPAWLDCGKPVRRAAGLAAAPWLVLRLRGVLYAAEAHSSGVGRWPAHRPQELQQWLAPRRGVELAESLWPGMPRLMPHCG